MSTVPAIAASACPLCRVAMVPQRSPWGEWSAECHACGAQGLMVDAALRAGWLRDAGFETSGFSLPCPTCTEDRLRLALAPGAGRPLGCAHCGTVWRARQPVAASVPDLSPDATAARADAVPLPTAPSFDWRAGIEVTPVARLVAFFVIAAVSLVIGGSGIASFGLDLTLNMFAHEAGHAVASWLAGQKAVPLPFLTVHLGERSVGIALLAGACWLAAAAWAWRKRRWFYVAIAVASLALCLRYGIAGDDGDAAMFIAYAGVAGELSLAGLLATAFFHRVTRRAHWDLTRYAALAIGLVLLFDGWLSWAAIASDPSRLPLGSAFGGADDAGGDMNRLLAEGGHTPRSIAESYLALAEFWGWLLVGHVAWLGRDAWRWWNARHGAAAARR